MSASANKWWCITSISTSTGWVLFYLLCCFCPSTSGIFFSITLKSTSALSPAVIPSREIYWARGCVQHLLEEKLQALSHKISLSAPQVLYLLPFALAEGFFSWCYTLQNSSNTTKKINVAPVSEYSACLIPSRIRRLIGDLAPVAEGRGCVPAAGCYDQEPLSIKACLPVSHYAAYSR